MTKKELLELLESRGVLASQVQEIVLPEVRGLIADRELIRAAGLAREAMKGTGHVMNQPTKLEGAAIRYSKALERNESAARDLAYHRKGLREAHRNVRASSAELAQARIELDGEASAAEDRAIADAFNGQRAQSLGLGLDLNGAPPAPTSAVTVAE